VLTLGENTSTSKTPYQNGDIKRVFLFCLYVGSRYLRYCDEVDLKCSNVDYSGKRIKFEQAKIKGHSIIIITVKPNNYYYP